MWTDWLNSLPVYSAAKRDQPAVCLSHLVQYLNFDELSVFERSVKPTERPIGRIDTLADAQLHATSLAETHERGLNRGGDGAVC